MRFTAFAFAALAAAQTPPPSFGSPEMTGEGREIFKLNCSVGYCHGAEGKAGRGPRIQGRTFERDYLYRVTRDGIPRSAMPAWKDRLNEKQLWAVVSYMASISQTSASSSTSSAAEPPTTASATVKSEGGPVYGERSKGRAIFFDSSNDSRCAGCHSEEGKGAGPSLAGVRGRPAHELLRDIVAPGARFNPRFRAVEVTLKDGQKFTGVRGEESGGSVRFYDVTALPPVQRTIAASTIAGETPAEGSPMPAKFGETYTFQQLAHLVAYLKGQDLSIADLLP